MRRIAIATLAIAIATGAFTAFGALMSPAALAQTAEDPAGIAEYLTPETFDGDVLIEKIEASDAVASIEKTMMKLAIKKAMKQPERVPVAIDQIKGYFGMDAG